jgi:hypothetical protein
MTKRLEPYRVEAHNTAKTSENKVYQPREHAAGSNDRGAAVSWLEAIDALAVVVPGLLPDIHELAARRTWIAG